MNQALFCFVRPFHLVLFILFMETTIVCAAPIVTEEPERLAEAARLGSSYS